MNLKSNSFFIFFAILPLLTFGQINLRGKLRDSTQTPLTGVNIVLTDLEDNNIAGGTATDDKGEFQFSDLKKGTYNIEFSYLGYAPQEKEINLKKDTDLGELSLQEDSSQLDEVVVSAEREKPVMEMKIDRTIFNLSQSDAAVGGNTIDALRITPGLKIKDADSEIEMVGKGTVKLMIDDKEIRLHGESAFEYLKSIPSDQIESIEMITNPPSKYTAEGSYGIINIKLKKGAQDNFYGVISGSLKKARKWSNNENLSLFYHKNDLQINAGGHYNDYRYPNSNKQIIYYPDYSFYENADFEGKTQGFGGFLELEYDFSKNTSIGGNIRYSKTPDGGSSFSARDNYVSENETDSTLQTTSRSKQTYKNKNYSFYLDHKLDTPGSKLSGEMSYTNYDNNRDEGSTTQNTSSDEEYDLSSANNQRIELYYAALDVELKQDFAEYSFGIQAKNSKTHNAADYENPDLVDQNSRFNYDEGIYSAYLSASKDFNEKWSLKLGLRGEYTRSKGNSLSLVEVTKRDYFEVFPTAYLNYKFNSENDFTFSYGKRIDRPTYNHLNPFRQYLSRYSYIKGNPYLRPAYNNNVELKHLYKNKLSSSIYFSYIPNDYDDLDVVSKDSPILATVYDNYLKTYKFGITESYEWKPFSWWESDNTGRVYYSKSTTTNPNARPKLSGFGAYINTNNTLNLNKEKTLRANFNFTYYTPEANGVYKDDAYYFLDLGFTALFFSKDLTITLNASDIFKTAIYKTRSEVNGIPQYFEGYYGSRYIKFSASYKFGNSKNKKERKVSDENEGRI